MARIGAPAVPGRRLTVISDRVRWQPPSMPSSAWWHA